MCAKNVQEHAVSTARISWSRQDLTLFIPFFKVFVPLLNPVRQFPSSSTAPNTLSSGSHFFEREEILGFAALNRLVSDSDELCLWEMSAVDVAAGFSREAPGRTAPRA